MKKKEARRQKLMEKNHISRQEKKRKKKLEALNRKIKSLINVFLYDQNPFISPESGFKIRGISFVDFR